MVESLGMKGAQKFIYQVITSFFCALKTIIEIRLPFQPKGLQYEMAK
jgi:hypothetical protein